jgi:hypothetical protein
MARGDADVEHVEAAAAARGTLPKVQAQRPTFCS